MTEGAQFVVGGILLAASYVAMVGDAWLTMRGLESGKKEVGIISRLYLKTAADTKKIPLAAFIGAVGATVLGAVFGRMGANYLLAFSAPLCAALVANDIRNIVTLRKAGIKILSK